MTSVWTWRFCLPLVKCSFQTWVPLILGFSVWYLGQQRLFGMLLNPSCWTDRECWWRSELDPSSDRSVSQMSANVLTPSGGGLMSGCQRSGSTRTAVPTTEALTESQTEVWKRILKILSPAAEKVRLEKEKNFCKPGQIRSSIKALGSSLIKLLISKVVNCL